MLERISKYIQLKNFWGITYKFYSLGLTFLTSWFIGRFLGPEKLGEYSLIQSTFLLFTTIITGGSDILVSLEFSLKNFNGSSFSSSIIFRSIVVGLSLCILSIFNIIPFSYVLVLLLFLVVNIFNYLESYYLSVGEVKKYLFIYIFITAPFFLVKTYVLYITHNLIFKFISDAIELTLLLSLGYFFIRKFVSFKKVIFKRTTYFEKVEFIKSLMPLLLNSVFLILYTRIDQFFIHKYFGNASLGIYSSYLQFTSIITIPISAIAIQSFPELARLNASNDGSYETHASILTKKVILYNVFWILFIVIAGNRFYDSLYGNKYDFNLYDVVILSVGVMFNCTGMIAGQLSVINKSFWLPISRSILGLLISISCSMTLLPIYSTRGAVVGFLITSFITNFLAYSFFKSGRAIFTLQSNSIFS
jgi:O-antigen/teichoic acid export membrane protein